MPTVEQNRAAWDGSYDWSRGGDEWSEGWGGAEMQWWGCLMPRIHSFVPCGEILEIAPGYGRWTNFIKDLCRQLTVVDLSQRCISACQQRFAHCNHITYAVTDGRSLTMVPDGTVDFVFSFDSLVHAAPEVIEAYVRQFARKLKPDGVGFLHHSNAGKYRAYFSLTTRLPRGRRLLSRFGVINHDHWRDLDMTAELFREFCVKAELSCISQELINWGGRFLIDSISIFTPKESRWDRPFRLVTNRGFMREAKELKRISGIYTAVSLRE